ncbi:myo-inosose-2 dehydratase [Geobacillus thermodenitrificans]|jgi:inosose dehydratase|uniref:Inosose dehydratase n=1 Tax=Geobacillus thermodenitrificans (strain NG80-2) TaxID=420246 RepID=IOLE_GEOTN|nr:myo-inosose-2 dehydratase [Geobacillus thermodenitrificans]A4IPB5.1 RecName: Full=Inosose dehydratase; AltName: Full=2-keto-myo-inositol dehydratase; Short=2KMI dehydratase [Geobacillus thermodenitrificans NG80-2]ABO67169.1 Myo-inositol catabolism protein IolE [Geobacillus thermodenitrificans NG80-2]ARA99598.1 myo-inosose-2 dehydratase [Geobacillus thermodenitrificans]ARP42934.1 Inosose dehydratase [Geobacillus thermodenitrificans]MED3716354.1 myo-inosose-2 dehydratase [Geobacillus thermode
MFKENKVKLGIAPIGWTNDDMPELGGEITFEQCISEMALAGFVGCEVGNKYPRDTKILKKALSLRGLSIASAWFSAFLTSKPFEETAEAFKAHRDFLYEMGAKVIVVSEQGNSIQGQMETPLFDKKPVFTEEEWDLLIDGLNRLGDLAAEKGMNIVYHHHMGTGIQTTEEIDRLMEETDPKKVSLLYDTGHLVFSGEDHLHVLNKHINRIRHVHLKDVRIEVANKVREEKMSFLQAVKAGVFTVPGDGVIDFKPVFEALDAAGYEGWFVVEAEQDPAIANPFEYALKARQYIRETCGL